MLVNPIPKPIKPKRKPSGYISPETERIVRERAGRLCEDCGKPPDWRGFVLAHWPLKGIGGTRKEYGPDQVKQKCHPCHNKNDHKLRES